MCSAAFAADSCLQTVRAGPEDECVAATVLQSSPEGPRLPLSPAVPACELAVAAWLWHVSCALPGEIRTYLAFALSDGGQFSQVLVCQTCSWYLALKRWPRGDQRHNLKPVYSLCPSHTHTHTHRTPLLPLTHGSFCTAHCVLGLALAEGGMGPWWNLHLARHCLSRRWPEGSEPLSGRQRKGLIHFDQ